MVADRAREKRASANKSGSAPPIAARGKACGRRRRPEHNLSAQLGISISRTAVRAVLVRRSRVVWFASRDIEQGSSHADALRHVIENARIDSFWKPRLTIAIGPTFAQVKRLDGLPAVKSAKTRLRLVRENAAAFFLQIGPRLLVSDLDDRGNAGVWAAGFDGTLVLSLIEVARARGIRDIIVLPFAVPMAALLKPAAHLLEEDGVTIELTSIDGGPVQSVRRVARSGGGTTVEFPGLAVFGKDASDFAAAYAAASFQGRMQFALRPEPDEKRARLVQRGSVAIACTLLVASLTAATLAGSFRLARQSDRAARTLAISRNSRSNAARTEGDLRRVSADLEQLARFQAERGRTTTLLGAISEVLPESTAVVTLRLDANDGSLSVLSPHAADVLPSLMKVEGVAAPRVVGSMTREVQASARVERVSIRFRRAPVVRR